VSAQGPISDVLFVGDVSGRDPAPNCRGFLASRWMKYHDLLHVVRDMHYSLPASMMDGETPFAVLHICVSRSQI
jgi:hypothetical protein